MSLVIFGAGGFAPYVFTIARLLSAKGSSDLNPIGFLDDNQEQKERIERLGVPLIGSISDPPREMNASHYAISVSSPRARREIALRADGLGLEPATLIHPDSTFCPCVEIGPGAIICAGTHFDSFVTIGQHAIINKNTIIGHDSILGDFVTISPMSVIGGGSTIGDGVTVGMTSTINPRTKVGNGSYIASGSAVLSDVPEHTLMAGVPARRKKNTPEWRSL